METIQRSKDVTEYLMTGAELRSSDPKEGPQRLFGYAAVFDSFSETMHDFAGPFREKIMRGAFAKPLAEKQDVVALINHDGLPIGRTVNGTLRLAEDDYGLLAEIDIPDTTDARDLMTLVRRKDVFQMSFAFRVAEGGDKWESTPDGDVRFVTGLSNLYDVSAVTRPAYVKSKIEAAGINSRSRTEWLQSRRPQPIVRLNRHRLELARRK